ncbi:hypothetical protein GQX74_013298 [Glossina fuscipes]|nr:hypothetical protein GQX74_013298 [Glossina fuscipes]
MCLAVYFGSVQTYGITGEMPMKGQYEELAGTVNSSYLLSFIDKILPKVSAPSNNNMMEMDIPSEPMSRRQRAGEEYSEESVGFGQVVKIFAALGILCTYPLQLNAAYYYIVDVLDIDKKDLIKYGLRILLVLLTLVLAMINPFHFEYIMGLLGSLCLSVLTLIVPGLTPFCTKNYGNVYWMGIVAVIALLTGITAFIAGTAQIIINWTAGDYSGCIWIWLQNGLATDAEIV